MRIARTSADLAPLAGGVLVPTMGALHDGHASLIRRAAAATRERSAEGMRRAVVVTIFVNPTQFNDPRDFERYPRTLDADLAICEAAGADAVFAPSADVVYPPGSPLQALALPTVADGPGLEDRFRPGHFAGVCQVVRRLFDLARPSGAVFGEKDWQQLQVALAMTVRDGLGVEIIPGATVHEADGLAMSSRNRFLSSEQRERAAAIPCALCAACGATTVADAEREMARVLADAGLETQYAVVRDALTLLPLRPDATPQNVGRPARALIAAVCGPVRLIDNCAWAHGAPERAA